MTDGQAASGPARPKIDDRYWFDFSEQLVGKAAQTLDDSATKLQNLVLWVWGVYTTSAAVGFTLVAHKLAFAAKLWIALPSGLLIVVYWATVWVQSAVLVRFDPRSPTEIRHAYARIVNVKAFRLTVALLLTLLVALFVGLALVVAAMAKEQASGPPDLEAFIRGEQGHRFLVVLGSVAESEDVHLRVLSERPGRSDTLAFEGFYKATANGSLQTSVPLDSNVIRVRVALELQRKGLGIKLSRGVAIADSGSTSR